MRNVPPTLTLPREGGGNFVLRRWLLLGPLGVAAAGGVGFLAMLRGLSTGSFDPRGVPSPLVGRRIPEFSLPAQSPSPQGFGAADLLAAGRPALVNFFASWCVPCLAEQPLLMQLKAAGVAIWGIAYKDADKAAADLLARTGDPYARIARDEPGRVAIDWGVYGVPETFFVDRSGTIRWRWAGPLSDDTIAQQVQPLLRKYG